MLFFCYFWPEILRKKISICGVWCRAIFWTSDLLAVSIICCSESYTTETWVLLELWRGTPLAFSCCQLKSNPCRGGSCKCLTVPVLPSSRWPAGQYFGVQIVALLYYREGASVGKDDFSHLAHSSKKLWLSSIFRFQGSILLINSISSVVLGIHDILVRIRIRIPGSAPLTNGYASFLQRL